jgi:hypothetical protein
MSLSAVSGNFLGRTFFCVLNYTYICPVKIVYPVLGKKDIKIYFL